LRKINKALIISFASVILIIIICATAVVLSPPTVTIHQPASMPQGYISADQALQTAMPYITQEAKADNRKVASIIVNFVNDTKDYQGARGSTGNSYPAWFVEADYLPRLDFWNSIGLMSYSQPDEVTIYIWADTGAYYETYVPPLAY
jgi:hypothetical protein